LPLAASSSAKNRLHAQRRGEPPRPPVNEEDRYARIRIAGVRGCCPRSGAGPGLLPDLKGTFKSLVYGTNVHHPGTQTATDPPRIREVETTVNVEGQDGRLVWGQAWTEGSPKDPFAWAIAADNKTIIGADLDGYQFMTVVSADEMQRCYTHAGVSPSGSIVATCGTIKQQK
jgi:hypothetical protein